MLTADQVQAHVDAGRRPRAGDDATAAFSAEHMHAAVEPNAPIYAEHVLTMAEVIAALKNWNEVGREARIAGFLAR